MTQDDTQPQAKTVLERSYRASLADVWDLWTTKDGFESWWGPQGFRVEVHDLDVRVGGPLNYDMIADAPQMVAAMKDSGQPTSHPTHSRFTVVEPGARLVLANDIDFLPGVEPYETCIEAVFSEADGVVRMVLTLDGLHDAEWTQRQRDGMSSQLTKLDERFGSTEQAG